MDNLTSCKMNSCAVTMVKKQNIATRLPHQDTPVRSFSIKISFPLVGNHYTNFYSIPFRALYSLTTQLCISKHCLYYASMLRTAMVHSFPLLYSILLCACTMIYLSGWNSSSCRFVVGLQWNFFSDD